VIESRCSKNVENFSTSSEPCAMAATISWWRRRRRGLNLGSADLLKESWRFVGCTAYRR
jgi:hypothetical protein